MSSPFSQTQKSKAKKQITKKKPYPYTFCWKVQLDPLKKQIHISNRHLDKINNNNKKDDYSVYHCCLSTPWVELFLFFVKIKKKWEKGEGGIFAVYVAKRTFHSL